MAAPPQQQQQQQEQQQLQQLLDLLNNGKDRRELEVFVKTLDDSSNSRQHLHNDRIQALLVASPYPTLQIFRLIFSRAKFHIGRIISGAVYQMLELECSDGDDSSLRFINMLANFPQQILEAATLQHKLIDYLLANSRQHEKLLLGLVAREDTQLLEGVLIKAQQTLWSHCSESAPSRQFVLQLTLEKRLHFVPQLCKQLKDFRCIEDATIRNSLLILRLADEFAIGTQTLDELGYIDKPLAAFDLQAVPEELREVHSFFHADFQRLHVLLEFLRQHDQVNKSLKVETLLRAPGILTLVYEQGIDCDSEQILQVIEDTYKWQQQTPALKCARTQELETLTYYMALCHTYAIILEEYEVPKPMLLQLSACLRQLRNIATLCSLIEDIFQLVFLRWEHLHANRNKAAAAAHKLHVYNSAGDDDNDDDDDDENERYVDNGHAAAGTAEASVRLRRRYGFICRAPALYALFSYLKNFVTKKLHTEDFKYAAELVQLRFQLIVNTITEALWKYNVLQKIQKSITKSPEQSPVSTACHLEPEELIQLVQLHSYAREKTSSDDESRERSNYASSLTRRKSRRHRRAATFSGATASEKATESSLTMEQCRARAHKLLSVLGTDARQHQQVTTRLAESSIIPKMLSSPEQLAIMALALKSFSDVKYIIETFHLESSNLKRELQYMEKQQPTKQKLATFYDNFLALEAQRGSHKSTVEQIKAVAAKGFELSKIISVVDNFAQAQKLHQSDDIKVLLQRHSTNPHYGFLHQFEERNLNALVVTDLILNLRFNREITSNLLLVIRRQQHQQQLSQSEILSRAENANLYWQKSQLPREMGAMILLENLCECMRLLERAGLKPALGALLVQHVHSLKPHQLALELQREGVFNTVYGKTSAEYANGRDLRTHLVYFQQLKSRHNYYVRFCSYVQQLARLLQLRDANVEYHTTELLKHDAYDVIGQLIYECDMTPMEIECYVGALNLNLVHVIALNICPMLSDEREQRSCKERRAVLPQKQESIHNYIAQHNHLLAQLLQSIQMGQMPLSGEAGLNFNYLHELTQLPEMRKLASMFNGNLVVAALRAYQFDSKRLQRIVESPQLQLQILLLDIGAQTESATLLQEQIDRLIVTLIETDARHIRLAVHMAHIGKRASLLQQHFTKIPTTQLAKELIERTLQHRAASQAIPANLRQSLEHTLADITTYARVSAVLQFETWPQAYDFSHKTPNVIFEQLLQQQLFALCYEWCQVVKLTTVYTAQQTTFLLTLLDALLEVENEVDSHLLRIIRLFPASALVNFLDTHKDKLRSLDLLQWVLDYLMQNARDTRIYRNYQVSLVMCRKLEPIERLHFWHLLRYPLLIIEQLIMNAKFEFLAKVMPAARDALQQCGASELCSYCFDKRGHTYDVQTPAGSPKSKTPQKVRFQLGQITSEAFMLLNFNLYQKDHVISNDCLDLLLRIYATKALDYHTADVHSTSLERCSQSTDVQSSLDSLCGAFQMPKQAPLREHWIPDEEATHCMCCRRAAFSMLMRRHHCRRCGRVVCYACSAQRMCIPELYAELEVRVCNECFERSIGSALAVDELPAQPAGELRLEHARSSLRVNIIEAYKWRLSGIITHDKLMREEFGYEHAPSVGLCLSILGHHQAQRQCIELLLFHCRKLEKIVPNPEVDYELVGKMMNCLALAAKVRGAPAEFETISENSDIIMAIVQQGCESLIPPGPLNNQNRRKLADALVEAEYWTLALEVHLKWRFPTTGVMAAHGLACLRAGCYEAARDKFGHCMARLSNEQLNGRLYGLLFGSDARPNDLAVIKRPQRGPPLLQEILKLIASTPQLQPQSETLQRVSFIRNSNTSLASLFSRRKEPHVPLMPLHEPAINIINALAGLKHIVKGQYGERTLPVSEESRRQSRSFEESFHYVFTYGSHSDILHFLMQQDELGAALKYTQLEQLEPEHFIHHIFQPMLASGQLPLLIEKLYQLDSVQLSAWRVPLLQTCRHLEQQHQLNSLYQLQLLLKDPIRASMTCVKFYALNAANFQDLHANAQHIRSAHMHLQSELDAAQWEYLQREQQTGRRASAASTRESACFAMQMDARALNGHINTIRRQMEVAKFLAKCEKDHAAASSNETLITEQVLKQIRLDTSRATLPTLFEGNIDKIQLCILLLLCGKNIDEGFGLAYGIIQEHRLAPLKVFGATAKYLARNQRLAEVERLIDCISSNNGNSSIAEIDEVLSIAINAAVQCHELETKQILDRLVKRISNVELRISSYVFIGQLKSAYLLANKYERLPDIRKILRQAELTNQIHIKKLCEKKLNINHPSPMAPTPL